MNREDLEPIVSRFSDFSVAVVGDLMLDRYIWGRASRISEEAPVPVVRVGHETSTPGGAANVVRNLLSLGARATAFGLVGADADGAELRQALATAGADVDGIAIDPARATTVKTRVLAGNQQVVRIDREQTGPAGDAMRQGLGEAVKRGLREGRFAAVILEDYAKGVLTRELADEVAAVGRETGTLVALDPHPSHPFKVNGLRVMTPNRSEAFALTGTYYQPGALPLRDDAALLGVGRLLLNDWAPDILLITLGGEGMALFTSGDAPVHIPTHAREVFDVSGAGDTVMATFVLALLARGSVLEAAQLANHAAGVVVGKVGTASVSHAELLAQLRGANA